jgi:membrane-associated phospholipid phosphatase
MRMVTTSGSEIVLVPWGLFLIWRWTREGRRKDALLFLAVVLGAEVVTQSVKLLIHRSRPEVLYSLPPAGTYSYPSGHAFVSTVFYGILASILTARPYSNRAKIGIWIATAVLLVGIGFSRVYLGYHFASDVIGGYSGAIAWLALAPSLSRRLPH